MSRPGLTEAAFRRYEPAIRDACKAFPKAVIVTLGDYTSLTVTARLRDALKSWRENKWKVDFDTTNIPNLCVKQLRNGEVVLGPPDAVISEPQRATTSTSGVLTLTHQDLTAFAHLITTKHIKGPVLFRLVTNIPDITTTTLADLEAEYNIAIVPEGDYFILT